MSRSSVAAHLPICPASAVLCCYSSRSHFDSVERWVFDAKPHIRLESHLGKKVKVVEDVLPCCDRPLRRCDLERHLRFVHADPNMLMQTCPFCPSKAFSSPRRNRLENSYMHTPASPLHPPTRMVRQQLNRLPKLVNLKPFQRITDSDHTIEPCGFVQPLIVPQFGPKTNPKPSADHFAAQAVFAKSDVLNRILELLPHNLFPMMLCVSKLMLEACCDPSHNAQRLLVTLKWEQIEMTDPDSETSRKVWRESEDWIVPDIPVPWISWEVETRTPCMGQHMKGCEARGRQASGTEMKRVSKALGEVMCPDGKEWARKIVDKPSSVEGGGEEGTSLEDGQEPPTERESEEEVVAAKEEKKEEKKKEEMPASSIAHFFSCVMAEDTWGLDAWMRKGMDVNQLNAAGYSALGLAEERMKKHSIEW
eukprot:CAMPEP_0181322570 /NCGR_PEP_ID=MMETSP1101-20121128/19299_1 /TAXON_ID=46948 /ORGANISM="Rhodomonas abbreviata, Strain Caron Lab Isolate" /LENGTH=420 /DNA_ID=CAMNT_0023430493 /DNA_START=149 /DNA_END=1408 /DNA_ORIENTATION=+